MSEENARGERLSLRITRRITAVVSVGVNELHVPPLCQVMSIEEVERIMDETQDAIEYQRVSAGESRSVAAVFLLTAQPYILGCVQQIDEMLAGSLSQEDEDAVLAELEAITQVRLRCLPAQLHPQLQ